MQALASDCPLITGRQRSSRGNRSSLKWAPIIEELTKWATALFTWLGEVNQKSSDIVRLQTHFCLFVYVLVQPTPPHTPHATTFQNLIWDCVERNQNVKKEEKKTEPQRCTSLSHCKPSQCENRCCNWCFKWITNAEWMNPECMAENGSTSLNCCHWKSRTAGSLPE